MCEKKMWSKQGCGEPKRNSGDDILKKHTVLQTGGIHVMRLLFVISINVSDVSWYKNFL